MWVRLCSLKNEAEVLRPLRQGRTLLRKTMSDALLEAIQTCDVDCLAQLLAAGADPNEDGKPRYIDDQDFPLQAAIGELEAYGENDHEIRASCCPRQWLDRVAPDRDPQCDRWVCRFYRTR
jgi:hypothetical protein